LTTRFINFSAFYVGWCACVIGSARGLTLIGPVVVAALLVCHFARSATNRRSETALIVTAGIVGFVIDTANLSAGVYRFVGRPDTWLCPLWLVAVWMIFATTLNGSMSWLAGRYALAAVLGAISGPMSYYAAARLGVIEFPHPLVGVLALAVVWALVVPGLLSLARLTAVRGRPLHGRKPPERTHTAVTFTG
jgi:Protein of unknown function (DUF2878)